MTGLFFLKRPELTQSCTVRAVVHKNTFIDRKEATH